MPGHCRAVIPAVATSRSQAKCHYGFTVQASGKPADARKLGYKALHFAEFAYGCGPGCRPLKTRICLKASSVPQPMQPQCSRGCVHVSMLPNRQPPL